MISRSMIIALINVGGKLLLEIYIWICNNLKNRAMKKGITHCFICIDCKGKGCLLCDMKGCIQKVFKNEKRKRKGVK